MQASSSNRPLRRRALPVGLASLSVLLAGCTQPDIDRPGTWQPSGSNEQNLRAMLVNPQDVEHGPSALTARGDSASRAVTRLLTDKRRQLLNVSVARVGASSDAAPDSAIAAPGAATP